MFRSEKDVCHGHGTHIARREASAFYVATAPALAESVTQGAAQRAVGRYVGLQRHLELVWPGAWTMKRVWNRLVELGRQS